MTIRSPFIFALCLLLPTLASAMNVPLPDGMCTLDAGKPEQAIAIDYLRGANVGYNKVLASFAPCDELDALAKKKTPGLTHYGAVLGQETHSEIPMDRATYLAGVVSTYQQGGKSVLYQDPRMVMGAAQQSNAYGGAPVQVASTTSTTLVGNMQVLVDYIEPQSEDADSSKAKEMLTRYTNQIIRANP